MRQWKVSVCDPPTFPPLLISPHHLLPLPTFASSCARLKPQQASPRTVGNMSAQLSATPPLYLHPLPLNLPSLYPFPFARTKYSLSFLCYLYRYRGRFHQFSFLFSYFGNQTKASASQKGARGRGRERVLARVLAAFWINLMPSDGRRWWWRWRWRW